MPTKKKKRRPGGGDDDEGEASSLSPAEEKRVKEASQTVEDQAQTVVHRADFLQFRLAPYLDSVDDKQRQKAVGLVSK